MEHHGWHVDDYIPWVEAFAMDDRPNGQIHQADVSEFVHQQGVIYTDMYIYTYTKIVYI